MYVDHLQLTDFRSYESVDLSLESGVTTFVGANGQGKTNLVEAIEYLSTMSSHRVAAEVPLVRSGAARAVVRARVQAGLDDPRQLLLELEINPGRRTAPSSTVPHFARPARSSGCCVRWCSRPWTSPSSRGSQRTSAVHR